MCTQVFSLIASVGHAGKKSNNRQFDTYGEPYGQNDIIGCLLDWEHCTIAFTKNGQDLGAAFQIAGPLQGKALYPAIYLKNAELVVNFGEQAFQYGPPQGYVGMAKAPTEWTSSGSARTAFWVKVSSKLWLWASSSLSTSKAKDKLSQHQLVQ